MESIEELKVHYQWRMEEDQNLRRISWLGEKYQEEWIQGLYDYLANFKDTSTYLPDEQVRERHRAKLKKWFVALFSGPHDGDYLRRLYRIGEIHVQIGLPPHYVSASMNFVRQFILKKLSLEVGDPVERDRIMESVNKILDLNLDVMTSSYREEEMKLYLASGKMQKAVIESLRRGAWFVDLFVIAAFSLVGVFIMGWIGYEALLVVKGDLSLEHGAISIMGSVLILYAISELVGEEIKHIRGAPLGPEVFIAVALAAMIRKILVISLDPEKVNELLIFALLILSLAATYWLIRNVGTKRIQ